MTEWVSNARTGAYRHRAGADCACIPPAARLFLECMHTPNRNGPETTSDTIDPDKERSRP